MPSPRLNWKGLSKIRELNGSKPIKSELTETIRSKILCILLYTTINSRHRKIYHSGDFLKSNRTRWTVSAKWQTSISLNHPNINLRTVEYNVVISKITCLGSQETELSNARSKDDANSQRSKHISQPSGSSKWLLYPVMTRGLDIYVHREKGMRFLAH